MATAGELFRNKIDALVDKVPEAKRAEAIAAIEAAIADVPPGDAPSIGKVVGPRLKTIEKAFVPAGPPEPSKEEKLKALLDEGIIDAELHHAMTQHFGKPGCGKAIEGAYGQIVATRDGSHDKTLLVGAYTQIKGYLFEQSRIALATAMAGALRANPYARKPKVTFRGVTGDGAVTTFKDVGIDNDVPIIPGRIWETKWYPRKNYGTDHHVVNQLLKYQAAVDAGVFEAVTVEVFGNIDPAFLRNLCEGREVASGLELFCPDVELVFALDELVSVTLKPSRNARSMARANERGRGIINAVRDRRYATFTNKVLTADDLYLVNDEALKPLYEVLHDGFVDPERITSVPAFLLYEQLVARKRRAAWEL